jgi:hypothetical protein
MRSAFGMVRETLAQDPAYGPAHPPSMPLADVNALCPQGRVGVCIGISAARSMYHIGRRGLFMSRVPWRIVTGTVPALHGLGGRCQLHSTSQSFTKHRW